MNHTYQVNGHKCLGYYWPQISSVISHNKVIDSAIPRKVMDNTARSFRIISKMK